MATYRDMADRHLAEALPILAEMAGRLQWDSEQLAAHRQQALRAFVRHAQDRSAWHAQRLAGVETERLTEADLPSLPTMSKDDLMANWDQIVTEPRLTLATAERHLDGLGDEGAYLLDEFHVCASGGSSGRRGVYVFGWREWAILWTSYVRFMIAVPGAGPQDAPVAAMIGARSPTHMSVALATTFSTLAGHRYPVGLPIVEVVEGLNALQPTMLVGYPSAMGILIDEQRAGRLAIAPRVVVATSEPLLPEVAAAISEVWGVVPVNVYATTDLGIMAVGCGRSDAMHLNDDLLICEPVDAANRPVAKGEHAAKLLVTSLFGTTLPLIRYELTDEVTVLPAACPCGSPFSRIAHVQGRTDDVFRYAGGVIVHPHVLRSPLSRCAAVVEYQVRQTDDGADVVVRASGPFDAPALRAQLAQALAGTGLRAAQVNVRVVDTIERTGMGKLKRFVPLG